MFGGALTALINLALTPFVAGGASFAQTAASSIFAWRQGLSAVAAISLLFGAMGIYAAHSETRGWFGTAAFVAASVGCVLLVATEWSQVFDIRDLAISAPDTLRMLDTRKGLTLSDLGAMISLSAFTLGWIALAAFTLLSRLLSRAAAGLVIAGFLAIPLLQAMFGLWGGIAGNVILGSGWIWLGLDVYRGVTTTSTRAS